jgi:hypothetical protein
MAKRKVTTVTEEVEEPKEDIKYEDIHDKTTEEIAAPKEEKPEVVEPKEKVVETPKEEEVEFDPNKFKEEVSKEATDKIVKALTGEGDKRKDSIDQELVSPWKKEGRNPKDYDEIAEWAVAKREILDKRGQVEKAKQEEEAQKAVKQNEESRVKSFNKYIDQQLDDLYKSGKLMTPQDPKNEKDPGVMQRKALFQSMLEVNTKRAEQGLDPIYSIKEIYYEHYKDPTRQPAGADAPVSMGKSGSSHDESPEDYTYEEIRKKNWLDFFRR